MVIAVTLTAIGLGLAAPSGAVPHASDSAALAAVASSCAGATTAAGDEHSRTFKRAGYLPARAFGENLAWGQGELGSPVHTLQLWLNSPPHRMNLMAPRWRDLGIAFERGRMFGRDGVALWVMQFGQRR